MEKATKGLRGFAAMSPEKRRGISRKGGLALRPDQRTFSQNADLARSAGSKGGNAPKRPRAEKKAEQPDLSFPPQ